MRAVSGNTSSKQTEIEEQTTSHLKRFEDGFTSILKREGYKEASTLGRYLLMTMHGIVMVSKSGCSNKSLSQLVTYALKPLERTD
ncbi:MAG: hypothetical protein ACYTDT_04655 [Planctomycetota bacterium]|jgi:hypothetical protein